MLELERGLVYVACVASVLVLASRSDAGRVVIGTWAAVTVVSACALATKLLPGSFTRFDSIDAYRLSEPIGYWNGLGALAAIGVLLALGVASAPGALPVRLAAAGSLPVLVLTLSFTYSRGAWVALVAGLAACIAFDPRRTRTALYALVVALPVGAAVAATASLPALTGVGTPLAAAAAAGRWLAAVVVLASAAAALFVAAAVAVEKRVRPAARVSSAAMPTLMALLSAAVVVALVLGGGPASIVERARSAFAAPPPSVAVGQSARVRLLSLSGSQRTLQWRVALDEFHHSPLVGTGAGTFELHWLAERPVGEKVRDAHSLYLETLGELGLVGLALLALVLAVPVAAALRARTTPLVPAALGAWTTFGVHAGVDWDWELPAVTLAALAAGAAIVVAARRRAAALALSNRLLGAAAVAVLTGFAVVGLAGNRALGSGWDALARGNAPAALGDAGTAKRWAPWSADPRRLAAAADSVRGRDGEALEEIRAATRIDPLDWDTWFDRAQLARGAEQRASLSRALTLDPLSPEIAEYLAANGIEPLRRRRS